MRHQLSAHFSREEFDCHDGAKADPARSLIVKLETLRSICSDQPLTIVSGYRTPAWNSRVGGAPSSLHLSNRAADIPQGYATLAQARRAGFTGIGVRAGWVVHVDVRVGRLVIFDD